MDATSTIFSAGFHVSLPHCSRSSLPCTPGAPAEASDRGVGKMQTYGARYFQQSNGWTSQRHEIEHFSPQPKRRRPVGSSCEGVSTPTAKLTSSSVLRTYLTWASSSPLIAGCTLSPAQAKQFFSLHTPESVTTKVRLVPDFDYNAAQQRHSVCGTLPQRQYDVDQNHGPSSACYGRCLPLQATDTHMVPAHPPQPAYLPLLQQHFKQHIHLQQQHLDQQFVRFKLQLKHQQELQTFQLHQILPAVTNASSCPVTVLQCRSAYVPQCTEPCCLGPNDACPLPPWLQGAALRLLPMPLTGCPQPALVPGPAWPCPGGAPAPAAAIPAPPPARLARLSLLAPSTPPLSCYGDAPRECILLLCRALCMSESTTARLALHIWNRIRGMVRLLVSVRPPAYARHLTVTGDVAASAERVYSVAALWLASKLEECRREVPPVLTLAQAALTSPAVLVAAEVRVLQWCEWTPYSGFVPDDSHLLIDL